MIELIVSLLIVGYLFVIALLLIVVGRYIKNLIFKKKQKIFILCGLHASRFLKPGEMGLLDPKNCEVCKKISRQ